MVPRAERVPAHLTVRYESNGLHLQGRAYDLSRSGLFVETPLADSPGTEARVCLETYLAPEPLCATCRVARSGDRPRPGMGLEFVEAHDKTRRAIERYCMQFDNGSRVLMVDDDAALLRMAGRFFDREQMKFVGIDLPINTQNVLARFDPAVVILDIMMPQVSGITVARMLREEPSTRDLPIIFYTAAGMDAIPDDLYHLPVIQKGEPWQQLVGEVRAAMQRVAQPAQPGS